MCRAAVGETTRSLSTEHYTVYLRERTVFDEQFDALSGREDADALLTAGEAVVLIVVLRVIELVLAVPVVTRVARQPL